MLLLVIMLIVIMLIVTNIVWFFYLSNIGNRIEKVKERIASLDRIEEDIDYLECFIHEYDILKQELEEKMQENSKLTADNEYLKAVCDSAKEEFEKLKEK